MRRLEELGKEERKMHQYKVKEFVKIIDGDTVDVLINLGFDITIKQRIRLLHINAAETRTKDLKEKEEGLFAKKWLEKELSREGEWIINTTKDDKYGRILGELYLVGDPITVNEKMLIEGVVRDY